MSQLEDINAIKAMFDRTKPINPTSNGLKSSFLSWFGKQTPYNKSSSPSTYKEAVARRDAFFKAEALGPNKTAAVNAKPVASDTTIVVPGPRPTLRVGIHKTNPSYKTYIEEWQRIVKVEDDGLFGGGTESATKKWQDVRGLVPDGVVGPKSWSQAQYESTKAMGQNASPIAAAASAAQQIAASANAAQVAASTAKTPAAKAKAVAQSVNQSINAAAAQAANVVTGKAPAPTTKAPAPQAQKTPAQQAQQAVVAVKSQLNTLHASTPVWLRAVAVTGGVFAALIGVKALAGKKRAA